MKRVKREYVWSLNVLALGAAGFSATGCAVEHEHATLLGEEDPVAAQEEAQVQPIAEVEVPDRGVVRFYEPAAGVVLIEEEGLIGGVPLVPRGQPTVDSLDLYRQLTGQEAPGVLFEAVARAKSLRDDERPITQAVREEIAPQNMTAARHVGADGRVEKVTAAATFQNFYDEWFYTTFCQHPPASWGHSHNWMFSTGSGNFTWPDMNVVSSTVSVFHGGSIHFRTRIRPWYTWMTLRDTMVQNGYYNSWWKDDWSTDFDVSVNVDQADGDGYHWCSYGD